MKRIILFLLLPALFTTVSAQGLFETAGDETENEQKASISLNGYVRGLAYGANEKYEISTSFAEMCLLGELQQKSAFLKADIRLRKGKAFNEDFQLIQVKELYAGFKGKQFDAFLGNQIVSWGRTDGFNPTDNIGSKEYFFLSDDPDDQLLSNFMLRMKYRLSPAIELDLIGIPYYQPSVYRYELFEMGPNVSFASESTPEKKLKNGTLAARLNFDFPAAGFSFSYFRGYDPYHGFGVQNTDWSTGSPVITNKAESYRKTSMGMDLAVPLGSLILRGEGAYNITENTENLMWIPKPDFSYVAGIEKQIYGFTIIAQYIGKYTPDFSELTIPVLSDPMNPMAQMQYAGELIDYENRMFNRRIFHQLKKNNQAISLTFNKSFAYDTWQAECTAYYDLTSAEWLIRPKLTAKISDHFSASIGGIYMYGEDKTLFGYSSAVMNGAFLSLKTFF